MKKNIKITDNLDKMNKIVKSGQNHHAFSIIEILVWIFIFSLWIVSVFAIISSTLRVNDYNENYIIAVNLANEQIELVRNIRDSNYTKIKKFNQINPSSEDYDIVFNYDSKYKIENDYSNTSAFPIEMTDITSWFEEWHTKLNWLSMLGYNICLDSLNRYTYDCSTSGNKRTKFYKYISFQKVEYVDWLVTKTIDDSYLVKSKVIWYINWYHEFELKSIIADWKRM